MKDPICHSDECQIGSFSTEETICKLNLCLIVGVEQVSDFSQGATQVYPAWNDKVFFTVDFASLALL